MLPQAEVQHHAMPRSLAKSGTRLSWLGLCVQHPHAHTVTLPCGLCKPHESLEPVITLDAVPWDMHYRLADFKRLGQIAGAGREKSMGEASYIEIIPVRSFSAPAIIQVKQRLENIHSIKSVKMQNFS